MKFLPKLVLVLTAAASCAAGAATVLTPQQDQERRDRNREEALAAYYASPQSRGDSSTYASTGAAKTTNAAHSGNDWKAKTQRAEDSVQSSAANAGHAVAVKTDQATKPVRNFTHRELDKLRDFSARQDARYGKTDTNQNGDAMK
jgi:hypothetical protein